MIIDCHIHCGLGNSELLTESGITYKNTVETMIQLVKIYKQKGIQALRDGGDVSGVGIILRAISKDSGLIYRTPIRAFYKKGLYGDFLGEHLENTKDGIRKMDALMKETPDFIKIILTGIMSFNEYGVSGAIGLSQGECTPIIDHAHQSGLSVMVHANSPAGIMMALASGADTIEHGYGIDDDCLHAMRESNVVWVPTLAPFANIAKCSDENPMKKYRKVSERYFRQHQQQVKKANAMGVNIALGSDSGATLVAHGQGTLDELGYLLDCGLTEEKLESIGKRVIDF